METFSLLKRHTNPGEVFVTQYDDPRDYEDRCLQGDPIPTTEERATLLHPRGIKPDQISGIFSFPVVSQTFRTFLEAAAVSFVEFHAVTLRCTATNEVDQTYSFMNLLDPIECIARDRSQLTPSEHDSQIIRRVERLVIDEAATQGRKLFRLSEIRPLILIHATLREQIQAVGLSGIVFMELSEYRR